MRDAAGKQRFDRSPTGRKIGVAGRQGPQAMERVRQNDKGVDMKRLGPPRFSNGVAQGVDFGCQKIGASVEQIDREDVTASRDSVAAGVRHRRANSKGWPEAHPTRFVSHFDAYQPNVRSPPLPDIPPRTNPSVRRPTLLDCPLERRAAARSALRRTWALWNECSPARLPDAAARHRPGAPPPQVRVLTSNPLQNQAPKLNRVSFAPRP